MPPLASPHAALRGGRAECSTLKPGAPCDSIVCSSGTVYGDTLDVRFNDASVSSYRLNVRSIGCLRTDSAAAAPTYNTRFGLTSHAARVIVN